jgi:uncharacterized membrane protein
MNSIVILLMIFAGLLLLVNGRMGLKVFVGLALNFALMIGGIYLFSMGLPVIPVLLGLSLLMILVAVESNALDESVSNKAFKSSLLAMLAVLALAMLCQHYLGLTGFGNESLDSLEELTLQIGVNLQTVGIAVMTLSAIGAIVEAAMAFLIDLSELLEEEPDISEGALVDECHIVGQQIFATSIHTLLFSVLGANLPLLIFFTKVHYSFGELVNSKLLLFELVMMLIGMFGILVAIVVAQHYFLKAFRTKDHAAE